MSNSALIGAAENYYKNNKTPDGKTGDIVGFLAGAKVGGDFAGKALNRPVTYIYKSPNPSLVPVNGATNGEQLLLEYKAMNTLPATNGTLAPSLTTSGALATIPLLTDGANKVNQVPALPNYLTKPEEGGIMVVGAGTKPKSGAYNTDINPKVGGVHFGDATNLVNVPTESQSKVIIENPYGFEPLNPEILRVVKHGGEIIITGIEKNKFFRKMFKKNKGENGELIVDITKIPPEYEVIESRKLIGSEKKQGYQSNGTPIQTKTDRVIILKKK